jgi:UDP-N-acetylglucosamine--N-acetylmuramyl-(pentapeptide) pyrophosphoryl-undecaprenol N-acetylglucosamine transferase
MKHAVSYARLTPPVPRRVAVAGGGTAGHVTSALAIMSAYQQIAGADVYFIGCSGGFEAQLVPSHGYDLEIIEGGPYARQSLLGKLRSLTGLAQGIWTARRLLKSRETNLVIGLGGYASVGTLLAAKILGIRSVIHEANVFPGLANRLAAGLSDRVFVGWEEARASFRGSKTVVTGNPIEAAIASAASRKINTCWQEGPRRILVTGGSQGSQFLNRKVPALLERVRGLGIPIVVRHQTGAGETAGVEDEYRRLGLAARVEPFIDDMAGAYSEAHFAIAAAGGLTLAELAAFGLPSLLVPLEVAANGHQVSNAKVFAERSGGGWITEHDWDVATLATLLAESLGDFDAWRAQACRVRQLASPHAAQRLVRECEALLARG